MEIFRELQSNSDGIMVIRYSYMQMIRSEDIVCVYTDRPYLVIVTKEKVKSHLLQFSIKQMIDILPGNFCICNQSTIVNVDYLTVWQKRKEEYWIRLITDHEFKVSRRCRNTLKGKWRFVYKLPEVEWVVTE